MKLTPTSALRDVAREHHQVGALGVHEPQQRLHDGWLLSPKMRIGYLQHHAHSASAVISAGD
jgi:hypothetical protein